jgi:hypothetical protein
MFRLPTVVVCAALLFSSSIISATAAPAAVPMSASTTATVATRGSITVGIYSPRDLHSGLPSGERVLIVLHIATPMAYAYDPATGGFTTVTPIPAENTNPTTGIGIVVKKNPGQSQYRVAPDSSGGTFAFPSTMAIGNYDIVITVPHNAINTKGTGCTRVGCNKGATITLHVSVGAKGNLRVTEGTLPAVMQQGATSTQ